MDPMTFLIFSIFIYKAGCLNSLSKKATNISQFYSVELGIFWGVQVSLNFGTKLIFCDDI